jgi:hypothetical protein
VRASIERRETAPCRRAARWLDRALVDEAAGAGNARREFAAGLLAHG